MRFSQAKYLTMRMPLITWETSDTRSSLFFMMMSSRTMTRRATTRVTGRSTSSTPMATRPAGPRNQTSSPTTQTTVTRLVMSSEMLSSSSWILSVSVLR